MAMKHFVHIEGETSHDCYLHTVHAFLFECETIPVRIDND